MPLKRVCCTVSGGWLGPSACPWQVLLCCMSAAATCILPDYRQIISFYLGTWRTTVQECSDAGRNFARVYLLWPAVEDPGCGVLPPCILYGTAVLEICHMLVVVADRCRCIRSSCQQLHCACPDLHLRTRLWCCFPAYCDVLLRWRSAVGLWVADRAAARGAVCCRQRTNSLLSSSHLSGGLYGQLCCSFCVKKKAQVTWVGSWQVLNGHLV